MGSDAAVSRGLRAAGGEPGHTVKFYGVSGAEYFNVVAQEGEVSENVARALAEAAGIAATALGLDAWGGDAMVDGDSFAIVDFNDWPSFSSGAHSGRASDRASRAETPGPPAPGLRAFVSGILCSTDPSLCPPLMTNGGRTHLVYRLS